MATTNIGELIKTATKNISINREVTDLEESQAEELAIEIQNAGANWVPVYIREISIHNFELVANVVTMRAIQIAGLKITTAIKMPSEEENPEACKQVQEFHGENEEEEEEDLKGDFINPITREVQTNETPTTEEEEEEEEKLENVPAKICTMLQNALESGVYREIQLALKAIRFYAPELINIKLNASKSILKQQAEAILA